MPKANWGITSSDVDDFDRSDLYTPYMGELPPSGVVYLWKMKKLQAVAATEDTVPQLRVGLELKPRTVREKKYKGYYIIAFLHISDKAMWKVAPFLDALGVSGRDFTSRTITDESGNVAKIGTWKNTGDFVIAAKLDDNDPEYAQKNPKKVGWMGEAPDSESDVDDDEDENEESTEEDEDFFDDEEETPKPSRRRTKQHGRSPARRRRRRAR